MKLAWIAIWITAGGVLTAAELYIGTVTSDGALWVDNAGVAGHATLFEGTAVGTEDAPAKLLLPGGVTLLLDKASHARAFRDRLLLEEGRAQINSGTAFRIEARTLQVALATPESRAIVSLRQTGAVEVGALTGEVRVRNARGLIVARVNPARAVELQPEAAGPSLVTGCVFKQGTAFVLEDEVSGVAIELRGQDLDAYAGKRLQVTGEAVMAPAVPPADQVLRASGLKLLDTGCSTALAASTGAAATGSRERIAIGPDGAAKIGSSGIGLSRAVVGGIGVATSSGALAHIAQGKRHKPPISHGR